MKIDHCLSLYIKINSKWIKDLNVRPEAMKFLEENTGGTLTNISLNNVFVALTPQGRATRTKINNWENVKLESLCAVKETIIKPERQHTEWENIFANHICNESKYPKCIKNLGSSITKNLIKKWSEDLNRHFSKKDIQMANGYMKRCSTSLIIKEMQIKTTMR